MASDPNVIVRRAVAAFMARIERAARFNQKEFDLFFGKWLVLNALGDDEHLPRPDMHGAVAKIDAQFAIENQKRLVSLGVIMPDEVALDTDDLELIFVHLRNNARLPEVFNQTELLEEIDGPI